MARLYGTARFASASGHNCGGKATIESGGGIRTNMRYREFRNNRLKMSEIGFGAWAIGGNEHGNSYGPTDDKVSLEAIHQALELGCNYFDTADVYGYGHSEEILGKGLRSQRDRIFIATKVGSDFYSGMGRQTFSPAY